MTRTLTVLIASHNRAALLERTLRHLNEARRPAGWNVDLLVAANACSDRTHSMLDRYIRDRAVPKHGSMQLPLRWVAETRPGKSYALNCATALLASEYTAFVDDDHRVDISYLASVARAAEDYPDADILCGRILPDWDGSEPAWVHDDGLYRIYPLPVPRYDLGPRPIRSPQDQVTPGGGNLVLRTSLFARVGDFSTSFGPVGRGLGGAEDHEWVLRAIAAGAVIQYVPDIVQFHYVDQTRLRLRYLVQKAYERSASAVRLMGTGGRRALVPLYMIRKSMQYGLAAATAPDERQRRFYLVRLAASLGEIKGHVLASLGGDAGTAP
jgi:GT2 family glycosyltransferase